VIRLGHCAGQPRKEWQRGCSGLRGASTDLIDDLIAFDGWENEPRDGPGVNLFYGYTLHFFYRAQADSAVTAVTLARPRAVMPVGEPALLRVASTRTRTTTATMNPSTPAVLHTPAFAQSNVAWSPFHTARIAVATSANYGIVGNGRLYIASTLSGPSGMSSVKLDKL
jgi:hypothetical protein